jgi:hypothetical protein
MWVRAGIHNNSVVAHSGRRNAANSSSRCQAAKARAVARLCFADIPLFPFGVLLGALVLSGRKPLV